MNNPHQRHPGFTMVEMLVVMLIIALLVSLAVPVFSSIPSRARQTLCASNQRQIGIAFAQFLMERFDAPGVDVLNEEIDFRPTAWPESLDENLGANPGVLLCPEADRVHPSMPDIRVRIDWLGVRDEMLFTHYPYWLESDYASLEAVCHVWKVNDEFYQLGIRGGANLPRYTPGEDPDIYWYTIEDIGDDDFYDFTVRVEERLGHNRIIIDGYHGVTYAIADHWIVGPDGQTYPDPARRDDGPIYSYDGNHLGPIEFILPVTHFGMNSQATRFRNGLHKILLLDYAELVCNTGTDLGIKPAYDISVQPRHRGMVNALFGDGSVELVDPWEIDPTTDEENHNRYWDPDVP
jgi:prepilin-type N-terminal cleavage/methylation domain-containing protein/prepilin-type processing-associated H-X9-DG protein